MFLLGIEYEPCKSCSILEEQLVIQRAENKQLLETILGFIKPEAIPQLSKQVEPIKPKSIPWGIRKNLLEQKARENRALIDREKLNNNIIGQSNEAIEKLEEELGIEDESLGNA